MSRHITSMQRSWQKEPEKFVNAAKKFKKQNTANDMFIFPSPATHRTNKNRTVVEIAQCPCMLRIPKLSPVSPLHLHCIAAAVGQVRKPGARLISCSPSLRIFPLVVGRILLGHLDVVLLFQYDRKRKKERRRIEGWPPPTTDTRECKVPHSDGRFTSGFPFLWKLFSRYCRGLTKPLISWQFYISDWNTFCLTKLKFSK